jgi:hypothetical protein
VEASGQLYTLATLPWEGAPLPIEYEAGCTPELVWIFLRREKYLACVGIPTQDHSAHSVLLY